MSNILIKGVEPALLREVNKAAIDAQVTQREWLLALLVRTVGGDHGAALPVPLEPDGAEGRGVQSSDPGKEKQLPRGIRKGRVQGGDEPKRAKKVPAVEKYGLTAECPLCESSKHVVEWGPGNRCTDCGKNF